MVERDLVLAKVATVDRCLDRIAQVTGGDPASLRNLDVTDVYVLNLQRAVQACIDLASHLVAEKQLGLPSTLKEAFTLLGRGGGLEATLAGRMERMVGFRNVAVHDYQALDPAVLEAIFLRHLGDLRAFCGYALRA
ncbi:MAG: DUF86 domain-containing protein [Myxococcota bacterium]